MTPGDNRGGRHGRHRHRHRHGGGQHPQHGGNHPQHGGGQGQGGDRQGGHQGGGHGGNRQHHQGGHGGHRQHGGPRPPKPPVSSGLDLEKFFGGKIPVAPHEWIQLEKGSKDVSMRAVDILAPIGKGQRGLIVAPPKAGKTTLLKQLAQAAMGAEPNLKVYVLLIDERPEEVTDFKRSVQAEVFASSHDRPYEEHIQVAEQLFNKAAAEASSGGDVLILLDSLTRLSRVHNAFAQGSRTMSGGLDSRAMEIPRRFFGAARKLEGSGSLTILATILVDTGSRMDEVIFQEFKGTGNMELVLSRQAAEQRLFPALNVRATGTRKEEALFPAATLQNVWKLRRVLASMPDLEATRKLVELLQMYPTNAALLGTLEGV